MQVIFTQNVGSAKTDDIKNVKSGYARYLLRYNYAVIATPELIAEAEKRQAEKIKVLAEVKAKAQEVANNLKDITLEFTEKAKEDHLYGSVNEVMIAEKLLEIAKIEVKKEQVKLKSHIKTTGEHKVTIHLAEEVNATVKIVITALDEKKDKDTTKKKKAAKDEKNSTTDKDLKEDTKK